MQKTDSSVWIFLSRTGFFKVKDKNNLKFLGGLPHRIDMKDPKKKKKICVIE